MSGVRLLSFFTVSGRNQFLAGPAHLPSMVRANERGSFVLFFSVPRAEISSPQRPAH